ncbi:hypothetical protein [Vibrio coralliirubri]|uniref:hypothetical protein n=1 Tax=Vibrio coralliirubri TaxID=1516159 RepID=UPI000638B775|nr:hypothetical protein [Vibrio coralliirubri]CDT61852.1 putative lipoprotein [Vibrio coralliirubri]CDT90392.1 putative lipoprotein [Vibrio coralliirubri]CDU10900.1 putative lipoprotein [Vibrio coralliirubri]
MKKVSLLAASVAFALTGCGGSDGDSASTSPSGVTITGFDGYFNQAVVFDDKDNNGVLDIGSDVIFGLTNDQGQIEISGDISGALALQTLTPGGTVQTALANHDSSKYAGKYTIDMDHPAQAMAHELVFRAPTSSDVISPITDLVAIEMAKGTDAAPVTEEEAVAIVSTALGGTEEAPIDPYSDFISGADANAELHKTAQILTESKAANPTTYEEKSDQFAKEADAIVDMLTSDQLADNDLKPFIEDNAASGDDLDPVVVTNNKLVVITSVLETEQGKIPTLEENGSSSNIVLDITGLFVDKDQTTITPVVTHNIPAASGIVVTLTDNTLTLFASDYINASGDFEVTLTAEDKNLIPEVVGSAIVTFNVKIEAANQAPTVDYTEYDALQAEINNWQLEVGVPFEQTINIVNLFTDKDGDIVSYRTGALTIPGLVVSPQEGTNPIITVSGTPTKATAADASEAFMVGGVDNEGAAAYQEMLMPGVAEGTLPKPDLHPLEGKTWYMLEHGDSNGENEQNYASIWCDSIKFEDGIVLGNVRSIANKTSCSAADTQTENATYEVIDGKLFATFEFEEDGQDLVETFQVELFEDADDISTGAKTIIHRIKDSTEDSAERYTYFSNKTDIEKRINVTSEMGPDARYFTAYLPAEQDLTYNLGTIGLALNENFNPNDSDAMDAGLSFDVPNNDFTCETVKEFFSGFYFTGEDIGEVKSREYNGTPIECYTNEENGVNYASVDFDLPALTVNNVYSVIGKVKNSDGEYLEAVKFNIKWTGTGNNE